MGRAHGAVQPAHTWLVITLLSTRPVAPKPIWTPFCAMKGVDPHPVTTLVLATRRSVPASLPVIPFF